MQLFVEDYCSRVSESIQTRMRANQERLWRKGLDVSKLPLGNLSGEHLRNPRKVQTNSEQSQPKVVPPSFITFVNRRT